MSTPLPKPPTQQKSGGKKNKKQYRVRNWREYNQALVNRGRIVFWITEEAIRAWEQRKKTGKRGRPKTFSAIAIETALTVGQVFHLPLRQTEGLLTDMLEKLGTTVNAPDYSTLSIRGRTLPIRIRVRPLRDEPLHIVVDSTSAKVYGEGEWKVRQHGWSKRRTWKKLHIGVDEKTGDILVGEVTGNDTADSEMAEPLFDQLPPTTPIDQVSADGAFDRRHCYETLVAREVRTIAIPPREDARIWQHGNRKGHPLPRDENLRAIRSMGRKAWKRESNYHRRSLVENTVFRLKTIFTERVSARTEEGQRMQLLLRCRILNRMTAWGMPESYAVA